MTEVTYYFDIDAGSNWDDNANAFDGNIATYASKFTTDPGGWYVISANHNTCPGTDLGDVADIELRLYGKASATCQVSLSCYVGDWETTSQLVFLTSPRWSVYISVLPVDLTNIWTDIRDSVFLVIDAVTGKTVYVSKMELRVTYEPAAAAAGRVGIYGARGAVALPGGVRIQGGNHG